MKERKRINKNHPEYEEYSKEFDRLVQAMTDEEDQVEAETRDFRGMDGPVTAVHKKYAKKMTELQNQYAHLFIEEDV